MWVREAKGRNPTGVTKDRVSIVGSQGSWLQIAQPPPRKKRTEKGKGRGGEGKGGPKDGAVKRRDTFALVGLTSIISAVENEPKEGGVMCGRPFVFVG